MTDCTRLPARTPRQLIAVSSASAAAAITKRERPVRKLQKVSSKRDCHRGHAASLNHKQQHPSIKKGDCRMQRFAQIGILPADYRQPRGQFRVDKSAGERDHARRQSRQQYVTNQ